MNILNNDNNTNSNNNELILTRYLYIYDEVRFALLLSLLDKNLNASFWAYELYYSGFKKELIEWLWIIYYDFFSTLNPSFESFILTKVKDLSDLTIKIIIENLLIRPFNIDVFRLSKNVKENEKEKTTKNKNNKTNEKNIQKWINTNDFESISQFVLSNIEMKPLEIYETFLNHFPNLKNKTETYLKQFKKITALLPELTNKILLSKIMTLFTLDKKKNKKGKNLYMIVTLKEIEEFQTLDPIQTNTKSYRFLNLACKHPIYQNKYLGNFDLQRDKVDNIIDLYNHEWIYYASKSPLWLERIKQFQGSRDDDAKTIAFPCDDKYEEFHDLYDYEPDEQSNLLKEKVIPVISRENNWIDFYKTYNKDGLLL